MKKNQTAEWSRRSLLFTAAAIPAVSAIAVEGAQAQQKVAQNTVQYQDTPKNGQQCDTCVNWEPPNACKIVVGPIAPKGWCVAYAPKQG